MAMNIQNPNRPYATTAQAAPARLPANRPGLLSRIGKAVGDILNGPQVTYKNKTGAGSIDSFQKATSNYQVNVQKNLHALTAKGNSNRTPLNHLDGKMVAWMNQELIGAAPVAARPTVASASRPVAPQSAARRL